MKPIMIHNNSSEDSRDESKDSSGIIDSYEIDN